MKRPSIGVTGPFDDLRSRHVRFLQEAARLGEVTVFLWSDELIRRLSGNLPRFPETERQYLLQALRFVHQARLVSQLDERSQLPAASASQVAMWAVTGEQNSEPKAEFCRERGIQYHLIQEAALAGFPPTAQVGKTPGARRVLVTGCYDWFHSGHVRFFEEVSAFGELYVVVGNDANIRMLKGEGHPLVPQEERRYMAGSVRHVTQALVSSGQGWLDAEPEIARIKPDIYAVNEDGDKGGKREFCTRHGIEYLVLKRQPAQGLPQRSSTNLRGF